MHALDKKMFRDLVHIWPQALAVATVLASGVATYILAVGAYRSLDETRSAYYERYRFAEVFAAVSRAPKAVAAEIARIPGVIVAEPRIRRFALLDIEGMDQPATGVAISVPDHRPMLLNQLYLRAGRMPEPGKMGEVTVNAAFAEAHGFTIGTRFHAVLNGRKRELTIVGLALSPEYIYAIGPGDLMPDDRRFAVMWMSERALAAIFDLDGAFNMLSVKLLHGTSEQAVIERIDALLERYGGAGAYGRTNHISHQFLDSELKQLSSLARVIPPIFLFVSAFLINMILSRLIALEREQIGLLKAIGYGKGAIAGHYLKFVAAIAVIGVVIGSVLGVWFGTELTRLYGRFFQFPFLIFQLDPDIFLTAGAIAICAALAGALKATFEALSLAPAVAMQPPAPPRYRRSFLARAGLTRLLSQMTVIALRNMQRQPQRSLLTGLGVALAVGLLIVSFFAIDSMESMIDMTFFRSERQHATLNFSDRQPWRAILAVQRLPGVLRAEPYRAVAIELRHGHLKRKTMLQGKPNDRELSRILDVAFRPVSLPPFGIVINERLAQVLDLRRGDTAEIELLDGRKTIKTVIIAGIITAYFGLDAHMTLTGLNEFLDEGPTINGVHISYDTSREPELFKAVKATPAIGAIALQRIAVERFRETVRENINMMTSVYINLSIIIAFGVLYNSARVQLSERARELASLRVLGFTQGEVSRILMVELALVTLLAQPVGWIIGYGFGWLTLTGFSSDLYRVPMVIEQATYAKASLVSLGAAAASALIVRRRIASLDLISVLKTRE